MSIREIQVFLNMDRTTLSTLMQFLDSRGTRAAFIYLYLANRLQYTQIRYSSLRSRYLLSNSTRLPVISGKPTLAVLSPIADCHHQTRHYFGMYQASNGQNLAQMVSSKCYIFRRLRTQLTRYSLYSLYFSDIQASNFPLGCLNRRKEGLYC